jgi:hypothetical protein
MSRLKPDSAWRRIEDTRFPAKAEIMALVQVNPQSMPSSSCQRRKDERKQESDRAFMRELERIDPALGKPHTEHGPSSRDNITGAAPC